MATFTDDFNDLISRRAEEASECEGYNKIYTEIDAISDKASQLAFELAALQSRTCYKLGFRDGINFMAGL